MKIKTMGVILIMAFAIFAVTSYLVWENIQIPHEGYKSYNLHGIVISEDKNEQSGSNYISAYFNTFDSRQLSDMMGYTKIEWKNETYGEFDLSTNVPLDLNEIILKTNNLCDGMPVKVNSKNIIFIISEQGNCDMNQITEKDSTKIIQMAKNTMNDVYTDKISKSLSQNQSKVIDEALQQGGYGVSDAEREVNPELKLKEAYISLWWAYKSEYSLKYAFLSNCMNQTNIILMQHNECYIPNYKSFMQYNTSKNIYSQYSFEYPSWGIDNNENSSIILNQVNWMKSDAERVDSAAIMCKNANKEINETFVYQKKYCNTKKVYFSFATIFFSLALIVFGIILGILLEKNTKK